MEYGLWEHEDAAQVFMHIGQTFAHLDSVISLCFGGKVFMTSLPGKGSAAHIGAAHIGENS